MSYGSSLPSFKKATFVPCLKRQLWTTWPSKVPGHFSKGLLLASKVSLNSLRLPGDTQSPGMTLSIMTFQTETWWIKPLLETGAIIKRADSYWVYANKHIAMKIILMKSCRILEGLDREKNINVPILLMKVCFTNCSREKKSFLLSGKQRFKISNILNQFVCLDYLPIFPWTQLFLKVS